jgi:hypothetical protein
MIACEATIAARIAIIKDGYSIPGGAALKNGFVHALQTTKLVVLSL